jgi:hypothetical protein
MSNYLDDSISYDEIKTLLDIDNSYVNLIFKIINKFDNVKWDFYTEFNKDIVNNKIIISTKGDVIYCEYDLSGKRVYECNLIKRRFDNEIIELKFNELKKYFFVIVHFKTL